LKVLVGLVAALAFTAGCAAPAPTSAARPMGAVSAASANCADLFAAAMASQKLVKGTWSCLSTRIQQQLAAIGLDGDAGVAQLASREPIYTQQKFMGRLSDGGFVYALSGRAAASVLIVWLDADGHVADLQTGGRQHP
jgi:hypothetical protein